MSKDSEGENSRPAKNHGPFTEEEYRQLLSCFDDSWGLPCDDEDVARVLHELSVASMQRRTDQ